MRAPRALPGGRLDTQSSALISGRALSCLQARRQPAVAATSADEPPGRIFAAQTTSRADVAWSGSLRLRERAPRLTPVRGGAGVLNTSLPCVRHPDLHLSPSA